MNVAEKVIYQDELDPEFGRWIAEVVGGEELRHCIQCGQCSSACPLSGYMDYSPRQIMRLAREGFKKEVLGANSIWLCASCYGCQVECPKQIKITDVMYQLKQRAIDEKVAPKGLPVPVLARAFANTVRSRGRVTESWLVVELFVRTNILKIFGMTRLGLGLLRTGRFAIKREVVKQREDVKRLLDAVDKAKVDKEVAKL